MHNGIFWSMRTCSLFALLITFPSNESLVVRLEISGILLIEFKPQAHRLHQPPQNLVRA